MRQPDIQEFKTNDIDLAAAIFTATQTQPTAYPGAHLVLFRFPATDAVLAVVTAYAAGSLELPVKRFAAIRAFMYRQVREVIKTGSAR